MTRATVAFIGDHIFLGAQPQARLAAAGFDVHMVPEAPSSGRIQAHADADFIVTWGKIDRGTAAVLGKGGVRLISLLSTGYEECINAEALHLLKVSGTGVSFTPGYSANAVSEFGLGLALMLRRKMALAFDTAAHASLGEWMGRDIAGTTCGIIGLGAVGTSMAVKLGALGATLCACTRRPGLRRALDLKIELTGLDDLFTRSDMVVICASLTDETRHLVRAPQLSALPAHAVVVNIARAEIIEPAEAAHVLSYRQDLGMAIDGDVALMHAQDWLRLRESSQVIWTPHMAFNSTHSLRRCTEIAVGNIFAYVSGLDDNRIV